MENTNNLDIENTENLEDVNNMGVDVDNVNVYKDGLDEDEDVDEENNNLMEQQTELQAPLNQNQNLPQDQNSDATLLMNQPTSQSGSFIPPEDFHPTEQS
eukprot:TRINITY_DN8063_c0_g1_i1.p1 TRINITY_DN8063_c0_g1~~TRINITY_DN8063_c0_g1_i1.p1  ORF type:complete len:112 (+),score=30.96 TRINITY_DN8063_c0_g1_i1:39-338(+)